MLINFVYQWISFLSLYPIFISSSISNYLDNSIVGKLKGRIFELPETKSKISGTPKVICEENDLALDIVTEKPFQVTLGEFSKF